MLNTSVLFKYFGVKWYMCVQYILLYFLVFLKWISDLCNYVTSRSSLELIVLVKNQKCDHVLLADRKIMV